MTKTNKPKQKGKAGTSKSAADQKKLLFVEAFLTNGENITQAAIAAGFSANSASAAGSRLLRDDRVLTEIERRRAEIVSNLRLDTDRLYQEIGRIAFSDIRKIMHDDGRMKLPKELDADTAAAIASFEFDLDGSIKYKFWDKNSAQERAAKVLGAFERTNKQVTDPFRDFLLALPGNVVGVVNDADCEDGE